MNLRRAVAFLLLIAVTTSSVEVLFGLETTLADSEVAPVLPGAQIGAVPDASGGAEDDCPCLCACLCSGSQLVVAPAAVPTGPTLAVAERHPEEDLRSPRFPFLRPPHRPPVA